MKDVSGFGFMTWIAYIGNVPIFKCTMALKATGYWVKITWYWLKIKKRKENSGQRLELHICTLSNA